MNAPGESTTQNVHVFTDEQLKELITSLKPTSTVSQVASVAKVGAEDVLANIKQMIADAEGTVGHVHGAAKQLQTDFKANWKMLALVAITVFNTVAILFPAILKAL